VSFDNGRIDVIGSSRSSVCEPCSNLKGELKAMPPGSKHFNLKKQRELRSFISMVEGFGSTFHIPV
jgi:hypothetical protein